MSEETIHWQPWTEENPPPADRPFLAWLGKDKNPWCCTLHALDDEGHYFDLCGGYDGPDIDLATHWATMPGGPR